MDTMSANSDVNQSINRLTDQLNCTKYQTNMKTHAGKLRFGHIVNAECEIYYKR
jgi:hypothetical protein